MQSLYYVIFDFFYSLVYTGDTLESGSLQNIYCNVGYMDSEGNSSYFMTIADWLCHTATIISITIIVILCCLFVYKIIKLIGGLIR